MTESVQMTLTLEWVGRPREEPWINSKEAPPVGALLQLFYRLNLIYAEAFTLDGRGWRLPPSNSSWYRSYRDWRELLDRYPAPRPSAPGPPLSGWPTHALTPPLSGEAELRFEAVAMSSPLDLIFHLPPAVVLPGGIAGALGFIGLLEKVWNAPKRIRLEGLELDRKILEEEESLEDIYRKHQNLDRDGFVLREGSAKFPDDWEWPEQD